MLINVNKVGEYANNINNNESTLKIDSVQLRKIKEMIGEDQLQYISDNLRSLLNINRTNNLDFLNESKTSSMRVIQKYDSFRVLLYIRLSIEDGDLIDGDVSRSIKNQLTLLLDECCKNGWIVVGIFCEEDISGVNDNRPEWLRALKFCETGHAEIFLCKSQSRFTRSMEMIEKYLHNKFIDWNIRFLGLVDKADTAERSNKKTRQVNGLVDEWKVEDQSIDTRRTLRELKSKGQYTGSFAPYGYQKDPDDKYHFIVDEQAAKVVQMIYELYKDGYGYFKIAQILNEKMILTPSEYKRQQGSKYYCDQAERNRYLYYQVEKNETLEMIAKKYKLSIEDIKKDNCLKDCRIEENQVLILIKKTHWNTDTIRKMLMDEVYIGTLVQGKRQGISYRNKKQVAIPKSQWIRVPHCHEAIIDNDTWLVVNERFKTRGKYRVSKNGEIHIFSKKVFCSCCGKSFLKNTYNTKFGKKGYLQCREKTQSGGLFCPNKTSIRIDELEKLVLDEINKKIKEYYDLSKLKNHYYEKNVYSKIDEEIKILQKEESTMTRVIQKNNSTLSLLYEDRVNGIITVNEFSILKIKCINQITETEQKIDKVKKEIEALVMKREQKIDIDKIFKKYKKLKKLDRVVMDIFIDKIMIGAVDSKTKIRKIEIIWNINI